MQRNAANRSKMQRNAAASYECSESQQTAAISNFFFGDLSPKASATSFKVKGQFGSSLPAWTTMTVRIAGMNGSVGLNSGWRRAAEKSQ